MCHTDALLWSAREVASMALSVEREKHTENVWQIALKMHDTYIRKQFQYFTI